jgi:ABC-type multidrug transport system ATPase subunit
MVALLTGSVGASVSAVSVGERVSFVKHQQLASGDSKLAYWGANFVFDFGLMFFAVFVFCVLLAIFCPGDFTGEGFGVVFLGGIFFSIATVFRFYVISYAVTDIQMAQSVYLFGSLFTMFGLVVALVAIVFKLYNGDVTTPLVQLMCVPATLVDPAFGWFLIIVFQHNFLGVVSQSDSSNMLTDVAVAEFVSLILACFLYFFIFVAMESGWCQCFDQSSSGGTNVVLKYDVESQADVNLDVLAEKRKVAQIVASDAVDSQNNAIFISNISKTYTSKSSASTKIAVNDLSLSIGCGEVFGLLGANGAGKTTLLKMVSGQERPDGGFALINGYDVVRNTSEAQRSMGLCPQFDTLVERLTVKENLLYFGQLKGLSGDTLTEVCEAFMVAMNIKKYQNKLIQQLSGGNRRKVSLVVALLGAPPTVYLDEPSTGLDPVASRLMWRLLSKISSVKQTAIVLTTHNMLECEAVCTRICIMKQGEMVCLGDSQHLRSAHGTGFLFEMTLSSPSKTDAAKQFVKSAFQFADMVDEHANTINFEIPKSSIEKLSSAFRLMESKKGKLGIVDYALSQSTLEQVFLKQIRAQDYTGKNIEGETEDLSGEPTEEDMRAGYAVWGVGLIVPGLHHFYLGNRFKGCVYFVTMNLFYMGWFIDGLFLKSLIRESIQKHGHTTLSLPSC